MPIPSLFTGAGALTTQQNAINVISNNIANVNTTAFKSSRIYFVEETSNMSRPASSPTGTIAGTNPFEIGTGMKLGDISTSFTPGPLKNTGSATDLALSGSGSSFFVVSSETDDEARSITAPQYTRDGHFMIDSDEHLCNANGDKVMGAMLYDNQTGKIRSLDGYSSVTFFADQEIGDMLPTNGTSSGLPIPTPDIDNKTGAVPVFNSSVLAELSVRGNLVQSGVGVNVALKGDLVVSKDADKKMIFTFDNGNAGTDASKFKCTLNTEQQILDNVLSFSMTNGNGDVVQLRIRFEPGVTSIEDVFKNIEYDKISESSDTMIFKAGDAQSSDNITVGDKDFEYMSVPDLRKLMSPIKIPNFFYTQDPNLEVETTNFKIEANGSISAFGPLSEEIKLGRILVANFINPDGLLNKGGNKYEESSNSGIAGISVVGGPFDKNAPSISAVKIVSGALEQSNVNLANEFAELIGFQRGLQANSRVIATSDEILQTLINL
jgi:flagellar hook protein FlgE